MPNLVGCIGIASWRVYTQNHGLNVIVVLKVFQISANVFGYDVSAIVKHTAWCHLYDFAFSVVNSNNSIITINIFHNITHGRNAHLVDALIGIDAQKFFNLTFHLVSIEQLVYQAFLDKTLWCGKQLVFIGIGVKCGDTNLSAFRNGFTNVCP